MRREYLLFRGTILEEGVYRNLINVQKYPHKEKVKVMNSISLFYPRKIKLSCGFFI